MSAVLEKCLSVWICLIISSWLVLDNAFSQKYHLGDFVSSSVHTIRCHLMLRWYLPGFSTLMLLFSPLLSVRKYFYIVQTSCPPSSFHPMVQSFIDYSCLNQLLVWCGVTVIKWWFFPTLSFLHLVVINLLEWSAFLSPPTHPPSFSPSLSYQCKIRYFFIQWVLIHYCHYSSWCSTCHGFGQ